MQRLCTGGEGEDGGVLYTMGGDTAAPAAGVALLFGRGGGGGSPADLELPHPCPQIQPFTAFREDLTNCN